MPQADQSLDLKQSKNCRWDSFLTSVDVVGTGFDYVVFLFFRFVRHTSKHWKSP